MKSWKQNCLDIPDFESRTYDWSSHINLVIFIFNTFKFEFRLATFFFSKIQVFLASLSSPRGCPIYVETMASVLVAQPSPSMHGKLHIMIGWF